MVQCLSSLRTHTCSLLTTYHDLQSLHHKNDCAIEKKTSTYTTNKHCLTRWQQKTDLYNLYALPSFLVTHNYDSNTLFIYTSLPSKLQSQHHKSKAFQTKLTEPRVFVFAVFRGKLPLPVGDTRLLKLHLVPKTGIQIKDAQLRHGPGHPHS